MESRYTFKEFSLSQRRTYDQAVQVYQAYLETSKQCRPFRGGMHWKRIKGREYLYQYRDRHGHGKSLGPRSEETERLFAEFARIRLDLKERLRSQGRQLAEQARFCRAALVQRVPVMVTRILRQLEQHDLLGSHLMVMDTNAIFAYEFAAGVFLDCPKDLDMLAPSRSRLTLATDLEMPGAHLLGLLRRGDRSFQLLPGNGFRAVNRQGYLVAVLNPGKPRPGRKNPRTAGEAGDQGPAESGDLQSLASSPKFSQVVLGRDGSPATMVVPDPRAFALHKLWLSEQDDRQDFQKLRDRSQAWAVADLTLRYLPQYHFFSANLRKFPEALVREAMRFGDESGLLTDWNIEY
jgi:hypothetical protein